MYMENYICTITFADNSGIAAPVGSGPPAYTAPSSSGCSVTLISYPNSSPMVFSAQFDKLKFVKKGIEKFIWLTFASPFWHASSSA